MTQNITRFENGVRLVTEHMPGTLSASIGIWAARGARHERASQNGIAHFLEHMAFKGTSKRNSRQIAESIENVGGYLNAYTAKDMTAYYARTMGADVPLALDVLSDILLDPLFSTDELEVERGVILQEIGQTNDTPDDVIFDWLAEESYKDQAIGRPILGTPERVKAFQASDFQAFMNDNYGGDNLVISAAGDVDHDKLARDVERHFSTLSYKVAPFSETANFTSGEKRVARDLEQAHFVMGLPAPSLLDDDQYAAQLLSAILGGGMSSRLFQNIREQHGLCYTIFSSLHMLNDHGQLVIYSGTSAEGIDPLMAQVGHEIKNFASSLIEVEINRAKSQMRAGSVMALEAASSRTERNARQIMLHDKLIPIEETLQKIDKVNIKDIAHVADRIFAGKPQLVLYGQIDQARDYDGFVAGMSD